MTRRARRRAVLAALLLAAALGSAAGPARADEEERLEDFEPRFLTALGTVRVQSSTAPVATCSGALAHHEGFVVTAGECVGPAEAGRAVTVSVGDGVADHAPVAAEVLEVTDDLALLRVPGRRLVPVVLADEVPARGAVYVVGWAPDAPLTDVNYVTLVETTLRRQAGQSGEPAYRVGASLAEGLLGGPVARPDGTVVGIASHAADGGARVTPVEKVVALLRRHHLRNEAGPTGEAAHEGVRIYTTFDWRGSAQALERALDLNPHLPSMRILHSVAAYEAIWQGPPPDDGPPRALLAAGAAALVVVVAGAALFLRRRALARTLAATTSH